MVAASMDHLYTSFAMVALCIGGMVLYVGSGRRHWYGALTGAPTFLEMVVRKMHLSLLGTDVR